MRVLYLSGFHPVLEYDECLLLELIGLEWVSTGIYLNPTLPLPISHLNIRKPIQSSFNKLQESFRQNFLRINTNYLNKFVRMSRPKVILTKEILQEIDVVFATQSTAVMENWEVLKDKPIVWRTVGSVNSTIEAEMTPYVNRGNVFPVRFSEVEFEALSSNGGVVIRPYVDEDIYNSWSGDAVSILSFLSWFKQRKSLKNVTAYIQFREENKDLNFKLYGAFLEKDPLLLGTVNWREQIKLYQNCRGYFYIGSNIPAPTYNFIEAAMTGLPLVTLGPKLGGHISPKTGKLLHEPADLIKEFDCGLASDDLSELALYCRALINNKNVSTLISKRSREMALKYFSKKLALIRWKEFFNNIN